MILQELFEAVPGGSDNYAENLAQKVFNVRPNLRSEDDVLNIGYKVAVQDLASQTRAVSLFSRDQDFPSDFVSAYYYLQKQRPSMAEGLNEDLQADDGEYYESADDFFGQFEAESFDNEEQSEDGMEIRGYIDGVNVMVWRYDDESMTGGYGYYDDSALSQGVAEGSLNEFAPGSDGGNSGHWYTDDELADIIGDDWFGDFDVSNDGFNIDAYGEKAKKNLVGYANSWFDDRGYNVNVMGVEHNDVDHDLQWYIVGSFQNDNFAKKDVPENSYKNSQAYRADGGANDEDHEGDARREKIENSGTWYIRLNGKIMKDKQGNPYSFRGKAAANKAALTMQAKLFNQGKEFMLTTNPNDPQQGVTEKIDSRFRKTEWIPIPDALKILKHYGATIEEWGGHFHFAYYDREGVRKRIEDLTWNADDTRNVRLSILNQAVRELKAQQQGVTEGAEIMYAEELAEKVFDQSPNLQNEDDIMTRGFQLAKKDPRIGGRVNAIFRTEDFPSDFVSYYRYIQHNHGISSGMNEQGVAEGLVSKTKQISENQYIPKHKRW